MSDEEYEMPSPLGDDEDGGATRPKGVRFGDGQDIRRGGRPAGSSNGSTIVKRVAKKRHRVKIDGKIRRLDTLQLVLRAVRTKARRGDLSAFDLQEAIKARLSHDEADAPKGILFVGASLTHEEWTAIYSPGSLNDAEVIRRYPYLKHAIVEHRRYLAERAQITLE